MAPTIVSRNIATRAMICICKRPKQVQTLSYMISEFLTTRLSSSSFFFSLFPSIKFSFSPPPAFAARRVRGACLRLREDAVSGLDDNSFLFSAIVQILTRLGLGSAARIELGTKPK